MIAPNLINHTPNHREVQLEKLMSTKSKAAHGHLTAGGVFEPELSCLSSGIHVFYRVLFHPKRGIFLRVLLTGHYDVSLSESKSIC